MRSVRFSLGVRAIGVRINKCRAAGAARARARARAAHVPCNFRSSLSGALRKRAGFNPSTSPCTAPRLQLHFEYLKSRGCLVGSGRLASNYRQVPPNEPGPRARRDRAGAAAAPAGPALHSPSNFVNSRKLNVFCAIIWQLFGNEQRNCPVLTELMCR
ncbi:hypothetical protein EVAR_75837_1 [Eumeta japonica]|uniref:Uncharacterized protein n=1 Tax=Eumeta variegata TaxID=151549 RepID=A0A4C1TE56_EUMVA|nr:hypothetical protein EVAR_75837_1 [Eumeta japonica]